MMWRCAATGAALVWVVSALVLGQARSVQPGDPLPGLTPPEFEEFRLGLDDFLEVETAEEGLGPAFNGTSCAACHNVPAVGGISPVAEVRAGRQMPDGSFAALDPGGESLFHLFSIPGHACQPTIPRDANVIVRRVPLPLFGAGLVEAIDDDTLVMLETLQSRGRDGVSGRAAVVTDRGTGERRIGSVRLEGPTCDVAGLRRRRVSERDGHHERPLPHGDRGGRRCGADASL